VPPPPPRTCLSTRCRAINGADILKENCYNAAQNTCLTRYGGSCPSDYSLTCLAFDSLDAPSDVCYDSKSTKKCLKKKAQLKKGVSKCAKPKVARKCRKTCGLCAGVPPPSPAPPPVG
jgi:hypothetical protein